MRSAPLLAVEHLEKQWEIPGDSSPVKVLEDINFEVTAGEFISIIGPSGCGKSTLLDIISGLAPATSGRVTISGQPVDGPHRDIGFIFQQDATFPWLTARENVEFGLKQRSSMVAGERQRRALEMLSLVGLSGYQDHYPDQLSGGMRQRVNIARVLVVAPKIVLMDEPFGALDELTRLRLGDELIRIWQATGSTILFVTHSLSEATLLSDRIVVMSSRPGRIHDIVESRLARPRTSSMIGDPGFSELAGRLWKLLSDA